MQQDLTRQYIRLKNALTKKPPPSSIVIRDLWRRLLEATDSSLAEHTNVYKWRSLVGSGVVAGVLDLLPMTIRSDQTVSAIFFTNWNPR